MVEKKFGFTLIELLVTATITIIVATISVSTLFSILKNSFKAALLNVTRQNGNYALSVMTNSLRNALMIKDCQEKSLTFLDKNSQEITFAFSENNISSTGANLISSGYKVTNSSFSCNNNDNFWLVSIAFTLEKDINSQRTEEKISLPFKTSVTLRNY